MQVARFSHLAACRSYGGHITHGTTRLAPTTLRARLSPLFSKLAPSSRPLLPPTSFQRCLFRCHSASDTAASPSTASRLLLELPTPEAQTTIKFCAIRVGRGKSIIVEAVTAGSEAAEAGVVPGQQLLALSDPIRAEETWPLNDRVSLRYVRDAIRMRRVAFVKLELSVAPLERWESSTSSSNAGGDSSSGGGGGGALDGEEGGGEAAVDLLSAIAAEVEATLSMDQDQTVQSSTDGATIGERLAAKAQGKSAGMTDFERRRARRKEYFEQTSNRNDTSFILGLLAAFVLPAAIILGVAASSGYLDTLAAGWSGR